MVSSPEGSFKKSCQKIAGDVLVSVTAGGDLQISGDAESNQVTISKYSNHYSITGHGTSVTLDGDVTSKLYYHFTVYIDASQVTGGVKMTTGAGDDSVTISSFYDDRDLRERR